MPWLLQLQRDAGEPRLEIRGEAELRRLILDVFLQVHLRVSGHRDQPPRARGAGALAAAMLAAPARSPTVRRCSHRRCRRSPRSAAESGGVGAGVGAGRGLRLGGRLGRRRRRGCLAPPSRSLDRPASCAWSSPGRSAPRSAAAWTGAGTPVGPVGPVVPFLSFSQRDARILFALTMKSCQISAGKVPPATGSPRYSVSIGLAPSGIADPHRDREVVVEADEPRVLVVLGRAGLARRELADLGRPAGARA